MTAYGFLFYGFGILSVYKILSLCAIFLNFGCRKLLEKEVCAEDVMGIQCCHTDILIVVTGRIFSSLPTTV